MAITVRPAEEIGLRPVASPVDTFVRAPTPQRSQLWNLAESLGRLEPELGRFLEQRQAERDETDAARGEEAFYRSNQEGYTQAVAAGLIPAHASPAFREAYQAAEGRVLGNQLTQRFYADFQQWEGRNGTDPEAFNEFYSGWLAANLPPSGESGQLEGLLPQIRQLNESAYNLWDRTVGDNMYNASVTAHSAGFNNAMNAGILAGAGEPTGPDYDTIYDDLIDQRALMLGTIDRATTDKQFVDAITTMAVSRGRPELLEMLNNTVPGEDYTWASTPYGAEQLAATQHTIEARARADVDFGYTQAQRLEQQASDDATRLAVNFIVAGEPIPEEVMALGQAGNPNFRADIVRAQATLQAGTVQEDQRDLTILEQDILAGGGLQAVIDATAAGVIQDPETFRTMANWALSLQSSGTSSETLRTSFPQLTQWEASIRALTTPSTMNGGMFDPGGWTEAGRQASTDLLVYLAQWSADHPNATDVERLVEGSKIAELIIAGIPRTDVGGIAEYARTPEAIARGQELGVLSPPAPAPAPAPMELRGTLITPEQRTEFQANITPEQTAMLTQAAAARGVPVEQLMDETIRVMQENAPDPVEEAAQAVTDAVDGIAEPPAVAATEPVAINTRMRDDAVAFATQRLAELNAAIHGGVAAGNPFIDTINAAVPNNTPTPGGQTVGELNASGSSNPADFASQYLGMDENANTATLAAFFREATGTDFNPATTPWCARFVTAVLAASGFDTTGGSDWARDYARFGTGVRSDDVQRGDIVVFDRHVGFVQRRYQDAEGNWFVDVLGGNQSDAVTVSTFREQATTVYRRAVPLERAG